MEILYVLLILLVVTRTLGELAVRCGQPALVGELFGGILLGMTVTHFCDSLPVLCDLGENSVFRAITDLAVFLLMLLAGIEMTPEDILGASRDAVPVAISGLLLPLTVGFGVAWLMLPDSNVKVAQCMFLGTALAITAVPVAVRVLMDLGQLKTRVGTVVVSAAVFDDVLSLLVLAVLTGLIRSGAIPDLTGFLLIGGRTLLFFAVTFVVGRYLVPLIGTRVRKLHSDEFEFSFLLILGLAYAVLAEWLHLHFILGAFIAGVFFVRQTIDPHTYNDVQRKLSALSTGFFAPVFFASIGLHLDLSSVTEVPGFVIILIAIAFATKLLGAAIPARLAGLSTVSAAAVGIAMSARGAVELIIAEIALRGGLFEQPTPRPPIVEHMFSVVVVVAIVTTIAVPVLLRWIADHLPQPHSEQQIEERTN